MSRRLSTVFVGMERADTASADDPAMVRHNIAATHYPTLAAHPEYAWDAVVDHDAAAREAVQQRWGVPIAARSAAELPAGFAPDAAVFATQSTNRLELLHRLPSIRALLVDTPLGTTLPETEAFLARCRKRDILVQVNLRHRGDTLFRRLADGYLQELIGRPQVLIGLYSDGLLCSGNCLIDCVRMLCGELIQEHSVLQSTPYTQPINLHPVQEPFTLRLHSGATALVHPLPAAQDRVIHLDVWGEWGCLQLEPEGSHVVVVPRCVDLLERSACGVAAGGPTLLNSTMDGALYELYDNLARAVQREAPLHSPAESALQTARIIDRLLWQSPGIDRPDAAVVSRG